VVTPTRQFFRNEIEKRIPRGSWEMNFWFESACFNGNWEISYHSAIQSKALIP
jgi:hypothetical protein